MSASNSPKFPRTRWSLVLATKGTEDQASSARAMSELCQTYWYPLYAHVRRASINATDAEDLTQSFFENLIQRDIFARVKPEGGRLRSYLLKSLNHFLSSETRKQHTQKRGGGRTIISIDQELAENRIRIEPIDTENPEILYERRWAETLMAKVLSELEQEWEAKGRLDHFRHIQPLLIPGAAEVPHRELGKALGITEGAARSTLFRMRQRYGELLRLTIADTVSNEDEVADEISHLMKVFRSNPA